MFPVILSIGSFTISSLGLFLFLAFFWGSFEIFRKMREEHFEDEEIFDLIFLGLFGGIIGARLLYILAHISDFGLNVIKWINLSINNQFLWLGFIIGMMYILRLVAKRRKYDFFGVLDLMVNGIITAQILVRIGQFLDGSYYGIITNLPWALKFPGIEGKRHPVQLYEIIILVIIQLLIKWLDKRYRLFKWYQDQRGEAKTGFLWLTYMFIFTLSQFYLDFLFERQTILPFLSIYQLIILGYLIFIMILFYLRAGKKIWTPSFQKTLGSLKRSGQKSTIIRPPMILGKIQPLNRKEKNNT